MTARKGSVPLSFLDLEGEGRQLNMPAGAHLWSAVIDAGYDPTNLAVRSKEVGSGVLAVGFFHNANDDFDHPIRELGFRLPLGFWHTSDGRMPLNWTGTEPPASYVVHQ